MKRVRESKNSDRLLPTSSFIPMSLLGRQQSPRSLGQGRQGAARRIIGTVILCLVTLSCLACSRDTDKRDADANADTVDYHLDLSGVATSSSQPLFLNVNGKQYPVVAHDDASFLRLQNDHDELDFANRDAVTHFVSDVSVRAGVVDHLYLTQGDPHSDPDHKLLLSFFSLGSLGGAAANGDEDQKYACDIVAAMAMVFNHPELATDDPEKAAIIMNHINPVDPAHVCDAKQPHRPEIIDLAKAINRAKKNGGIAVNEPLTSYSETPPEDATQNNLYWVPESDGTSSLVMFKDGSPSYVYRFTEDAEPTALPFKGDLSRKTPAVSYRIVDSVLNAAQPAVLAALKATKNDPRLEGVKYSLIEGTGLSQGSASLRVGDGQRPLAAGLKASDEKIVLSKGGGIDGMTIELASDEIEIDEHGFRTMTLKVKNYYLRHVALWVSWQAADGSRDTWWKDFPQKDGGVLAFYDAMKMPGWYEWVHDASQTSDSVFWGLVSNRAVIMGIPLSPEWTYFKIPIPPTSSRADLAFASMGTGQWHNENIVGAILTSVLDLGLPGYLLISGARDGIDGAPILKNAIKDPKVLTAVVGLGLSMGVYGEATGGSDYSGYAKALGAMLVNTGCDRLRYAIVKTVAKSEAENAIPFVGWGLYLAGLAANVSQLAQTIAEVATTPATHRDGLVATWSPTVRILPDPLNIRGGFPESAKTYEARVFFGEHEGMKLPMKGDPGLIGNTAVPYLDFTFKDIPEGGTATLRIDLLSDSGVVSGTVTAKVLNTARASPPNADGLNYTIQLTENMVNITPSTTFIHKDKIGRDQDGKHVWLGAVDAGGNYVAPPAPTATVVDLDCASSNGGLCALEDITLNIQGHSVGYSWQAFAKDTATCGGTGVSSGQRYSVQNLSVLGNLAGGPESLHVAGECNYLEYRPALAYSLIGDVRGHHVYVHPARVDGETRHFVQKVAIDPTLSFAPRDTAVGRLALAPTDMAIHPSGQLISINRDLGKMEVLELDVAPVPLAEAPSATLRLGEGDREGLLHSPVAVAVNQDGDILVLEQRNLRVSAFDTNGSLRRIFGDSAEPRNFFPLTNADASTVLLDMDVESTGMIFVLAHRNGGAAPSDYFVQVYSSKGTLIDTVTGVAAGKMAVDHFRNLFTLNYETLTGPDLSIAPSISLWTPQP